MMLQSNEGKIRVFPAVPAAWDSIPMAFILLARGAFLVSASRNNSAEVTQVGVKSLKGIFVDYRILGVTRNVKC